MVKIFDKLKLVSNKIFNTNFTTSYEKQFLFELNSALTYIDKDGATRLQPEARYKMGSK